MIELVQTLCKTIVLACLVWGSLANLACPERLFSSRMKLSVHASHLNSGSRCWCWGQGCNEAWIVLKKGAGTNARNGRTLQHPPFCPNPDIASRGVACKSSREMITGELGTSAWGRHPGIQAVVEHPGSYQWAARIMFSTHQVASSAKYLSACSFKQGAN